MLKPVPVALAQFDESLAGFKDEQTKHQETANLDGLIRSIQKYGLSVVRPPQEIVQLVKSKGYLDDEVAEIFYVCSALNFAQVISGEAQASVANKQSAVALSETVATAIKTAFSVEVKTEMNTLDIKLDVQRLRIVYLPSPSLLAVISLTGEKIPVTLY